MAGCPQFTMAQVAPVRHECNPCLARCVDVNENGSHIPKYFGSQLEGLGGATLLDEVCYFVFVGWEDFVVLKGQTIPC